MKDKSKKQEDLENNEVEELKKQVEDLENKWKRAMADYANYKKRAEQERLSLIEFSNLVLIKNLLPIIDNLQLASKHTDDIGIKMINTQFEELLKNEGVTKIDAQNKEFDANTMEAIEKEGEENTNLKTVVKSITKDGYTFNNKVIRPAQVVVTFK